MRWTELSSFHYRQLMHTSHGPAFSCPQKKVDVGPWSLCPLVLRLSHHRDSITMKWNEVSSFCALNIQKFCVLTPCMLGMTLTCGDQLAIQGRESALTQPGKHWQCLCHGREVHQPHQGLVQEGSSHWADDITQNQNLISMLGSTGIVSTGSCGSSAAAREMGDTQRILLNLRFKTVLFCIQNAKYLDYLST